MKKILTYLINYKRFKSKWVISAENQKIQEKKKNKMRMHQKKKNKN
jgi:hypothetical protein